MKNQRVVDEARRVFYVAVTRARQRLVMSGLARLDKQGNWQGSGDSPLAWLKEHYRLDLPPAGSAVSWPAPEMDVELLTAVQSLSRRDRVPRELPAAWDFSPEAAPFAGKFSLQPFASPGRNSHPAGNRSRDRWRRGPAPGSDHAPGPANPGPG